MTNAMTTNTCPGWSWTFEDEVSLKRVRPALDIGIETLSLAIREGDDRDYLKIGRTA